MVHYHARSHEALLGSFGLAWESSKCMAGKCMVISVTFYTRLFIDVLAL